MPSIPLIMSVDDLREALTYDDIDDVIIAMHEAILSGQQAVADAIRSDIVRATVVDEFWVTSARSYAGSNPQTELLLSNGFVDSGQTYTVYAAWNQKDLGDSGARVDLKSNSGVNHVVLDAEKGLIRIVDYDLTRLYVRVSYTMGFLDDDGSPPVYTGVPNWMYEAVKIKAQLLLDANPILPRPLERQGEFGQATSSVTRTLDSIITSHARYVPMSNKPYLSTVTPV